MLGAWLGLLPSVTASLTPAETRELYEADQRRYNRLAALVSWALVQMQAFTYDATSTAISRGFGGNAELLDVRWDKLMKQAPGFDAALDPGPQGPKRRVQTSAKRRKGRA